VVQKARAGAAETSGATSGARVAAYLRGEHPATTGEKLLDRLTAPQTAVPTMPALATAANETADQQKLEALTKPTLQPSLPPTPAEAAKPAELEKANEKLTSLLKGKS